MNFAFNPPLQLFGHTIYSFAGLLQYCEYYTKVLEDVGKGISDYISREARYILNQLKVEKGKREKAQDHWKKKYFKLKSRSHVKYEVFENPTTGVKVLIPKDCPRVNNQNLIPYNNWSPKDNIRELVNVLEHTLLPNVYFEKEKCETEKDTIMGSGYVNTPNPYKTFDSKQHLKKKITLG